MTLRIGLTGPIGCGKSTIAGWLGERPGVVVIDADVVARDVVGPGEPALEPVLARFGEGLRREDGTLDRAALGRIVFDDDDALRDLEAIIHPAVRLRILAAIDDAEVAGKAGVVIEAIKLVEGGLADVCDEVWLVTCDPAAQAARLVGRGSSSDDAARRVASQAGLEARARSKATRVIDSTGDMNATRAMVDRIWEAS